MKLSRRKLLLVLFVSCLGIQPSRATLFAVGPSLGLAGSYATFDLAQADKKIVINNFALQIGLFAKLSFWLLYAKVDPLFVWDWRRLPDAKEKTDKLCFQHITLPVTMGVPLFDCLRPHVGLIFRIPLSSPDLLQEKETDFIKECKKKATGWLLGIGIDLGNFVIDIDFERAFSSVSKKSINASIRDGDGDTYTPKQFSLRIGYNLLGLIG